MTDQATREAAADLIDGRIERMERRDGALLRKVGDVIAAEPERYDQMLFIAHSPECGTKACIAGHAALLHADLKDADPGCVVIAGRQVAVWDAAEEALGLTGLESGRLFCMTWEPAGDPATPLHERVRAALYALADGATVEEVTA